MKDSVVAIERNKSRTAYSFAGRDSQSDVHITFERVKALAGSRKPSFLAVNESGFLKQVQWRVALDSVFACDRHCGGSLIVGQAAVDHLISEVMKKVEAGEQVMLDHFQRFGACRWLLTQGHPTSTLLGLGTPCARHAPRPLRRRVCGRRGPERARCGWGFCAQQENEAERQGRRRRDHVLVPKTKRSHEPPSALEEF